MNFVVATIAGIGFNAYALRMLPVAVVSSAVAYLVLRRFYRSELYDDVPAGGTVPPPAPLSRTAHEAGVVLAVTLVAFPIVTALGGPVILVSLLSAAALVAIALGRRAISLRALAAEVPFPILGFLLGMFILVRGLENAGAVALLRAAYAALPDGPARILGVGSVSAVGSALLNNHPMAILNAVALEPRPGGDIAPILAALVGGDLGPRLLPTGSLAGLLWLERLRREGVAVSLRRYVRHARRADDVAVAAGGAPGALAGVVNAAVRTRSRSRSESRSGS
jgi:arsenical pump membrane protein